MISACFVDTGCWLALFNKDDELHEIADLEYKRCMKLGRMLITTTFVLTEFANALCQLKFRRAVIEFYQRLQYSSRIEIISIDERLWDAGWELYMKCLDKEWSLTDCISIVVMQEHGIVDALAHDKHFAQAGFCPILRESSTIRS